MAEPAGDRLTDAEIHRSVAATVRDVLLPALADDADWARATAVHLIGLTRYAAERGPDRSAERVDAVADCLAGLTGNTLVAAVWNDGRSEREVMEAAGAALAAAVGDDGPAATEVRAVLRPLLVRQLDDELAETSPLVDAFRGRLDE
jgi:hypothetical protein